MSTRTRPARRGIGHLYLALGERRGRRLHEEMCRATEFKPRLTPSLVLAYGVASSVHSLTFAFAGLGVWLIATRWRYGFYDFIGLLCLVVAWELRPRAPVWRGSTISRDRAPMLYDAADRVADALRGQKPDSIVALGEYGAWFGRIGWRRRRFLALGVPLLVALTPQERVALLAHELGHDVNGDPTRGLIVGTSLDTLEAWYWMLHPREVSGGWLATASGMLLLSLANAAKGIAYVLIHLLWQDQQRSEYLADQLAVRVGGTEAAASMLRKLYLANVYRTAVQSTALNRGSEVDLIADFRSRIFATPLEQLIREEESEAEAGFRLDATHPPTAYRIEFVIARSRVGAQVQLTEAESAQIDGEVASAWAPLQQDVLETFRASLYE